MKKGLLLLILIAGINSCSLLKFSIETGETPLTKQEYDTRSMTRGLYNESTNNIIRLSDSIVASDADIEIKLRAIRWKIVTTRSLADKALQTTPDAALLDTWIVSKQLSNAFNMMPDSLLLGQYSDLARKTFSHITNLAVKIAKEVNNKQRFELMQEFVNQYITDNPIKKNEFPVINSFLGWVEFLKEKQIPFVHSRGTTSEVISGMSDQVFGQVNQFANSIEWNKDMLELKFSEDSLNNKLMMQFDSLEHDFDRMLIFLEQTPEMVDVMSKEMSVMLEQILVTFNQNVNFTFQNLDVQRAEMQKFIDEQREILIDDVTKAAEQTIQQTIDTLPALIRSILLYIILFVFIIFGAPFALGLWIGKKRSKKNEQEK